MDFISKRQGYVPLKVVPYIFFAAVVLSITTKKYIRIVFKNLHRHESQLVGIQADFFNGNWSSDLEELNQN